MVTWQGVVKVQGSLHTSEKAQQVLAYNRDRSVHYMGPMPEAMAALLEGRPRAFFFASVSDERTLDIQYEVDGWEAQS